jgi:hypothetical protein
MAVCDDPTQQVRRQVLSGRQIKAMFLGCLTAGLMISGAAQAVQLITEEEARLPPPKGAVALDKRGILRGPKVEYVSTGETVHSPLHLQLKFQSFGGATIDLDSVRIIYLRAPNVDLTPRVRPFVRSTGVDIPDAELPPGEYTVRVDVKDSEGHSGTTSFVLKVVP